MPIVAFKCKDHGSYDCLLGMTAEPDDTTCPTCGKQGEQLISNVIFDMGMTCQEPGDLKPGDRAAVLKHKKWLSDNKSKIDSGEIGVKIQGPAWSIPKELQ